MIEFYQTVMGRRFFEADVPRFLEEMKRLNKNLEQLLKVVEGRKADERISVEGNAEAEAG